MLARQLLLRRRRAAVADVLERMVGLQAQVPEAPYVGLWSRVDRFDPEALVALYERRAVVRTTAMRATLHLLTRRDALAIRPVVQPVIARMELGQRSYVAAIDGVDLAPVRAAARELMDEEPRSTAELKQLLGERFPATDADALVRHVKCNEPIVQVPPRGLWRRKGQARWARIERWLGEPVAPRGDPQRLVLRYLAAFGPASVADIAAWSRLTGVRDIVEPLRPRLRVLRDERGHELLDVPRAPLPDPGLPVPPRFLPEFDNVLVAYADRDRVVASEHRDRVVRSLGRPTLLFDGFVTALWGVEHRDGTAALTVEQLESIPRAGRAAVVAEGERLLAFLAPEATTRRVVFA
jgi:hypothetical protein